MFYFTPLRSVLIGNINYSKRGSKTIALFPKDTLNTSRMATTTSRAAFEAVFPSLAADLLEHAKKYNLPENALKWFEQVSLG
jgi:hypothetical protein